MSTISATFVFAGINAEEGGLIRRDAGPSYWATERRIQLHRVLPFSIKDKAHAEDWVTLLQGIELQLLLSRAQPGDLSMTVIEETGTPMWEYLYGRSGGEIGSLTQLLRIGANRAIKTGSERITFDLLDGVRINQGREKHRQAAT